MQTRLEGGGRLRCLTCVDSILTVCVGRAALTVCAVDIKKVSDQCKDIFIDHASDEGPELPSVKFCRRG